jgi:transposase-like protein
MRFNYSSKRDLYYEKAMQLYFEEGMCGTHICKVLPISRAILYKWIAIFAEQNPQIASMKGVKKVKKVSKPSPESQAEELPKSVLELQAELKRLRAQLKKAEIKAEAYDELINVAEAKFNIPIRKKAGAKQ